MLSRKSIPATVLALALTALTWRGRRVLGDALHERTPLLEKQRFGRGDDDHVEEVPPRGVFAHRAAEDLWSAFGDALYTRTL